MRGSEFKTSCIWGVMVDKHKIESPAVMASKPAARSMFSEVLVILDKSEARATDSEPTVNLNCCQ